MIAPRYTRRILLQSRDLWGDAMVAVSTPELWGWVSELGLLEIATLLHADREGLIEVIRRQLLHISDMEYALIAGDSFEPKGILS